MAGLHCVQCIRQQPQTDTATLFLPFVISHVLYIQWTVNVTVRQQPVCIHDAMSLAMQASPVTSNIKAVMAYS